MTQNLHNFYVFVDTEKKIVIDKIQKLPQNWCNIAGLPELSDDQLKDLKWAGHDNKGWINIHSSEIKEYSCSVENLELNKNTFKDLIFNIRKEKQTEPIQYQGAQIKSNTKTLYSLFILQSKDNVNYKCINGYHTFTQEQIKELYGIMELNLQKWFDWEMNIYSQIDECQNVSDFSKVKINKNKI